MQELAPDIAQICFYPTAYGMMGAIINKNKYNREKKIMTYHRMPLSELGVRGPRDLDVLDLTPPPLGFSINAGLFADTPAEHTYKQPSGIDPQTFWQSGPGWQP